MASAVRGPHFDSSKDRWIVRWHDGDRGRARSFIGEADARAFAAERRGEQHPAAAVFELPTKADSSAIAWSSRLARLADAAIQALLAGDERAVRLVTSVGRCVAQLSTSERHHAEVGELARQLEEHERITAELLGEIELGTGADAGDDEPADFSGMRQVFMPGGGCRWEPADDEPN